MATTITTLNGLQDMANDLAADYILGNDIDASGSAAWNAGAGFVPIGDSTTEFTGSFDGKGYTITGLTINRPATNYVGLFGLAYGANISDVTLASVSIVGASKTGALAGGFDGAASVSECYSSGAVTGTANVGGLIGVLGDWYADWDGAVTDCNSSCAVTSDGSAGGLIGYLYRGGNITDSYATGAVAGGDSTGGFIGLVVDDAIIAGCYATGNVSISGAGSNAGGFIATLNHADALITQCYCTGTVAGRAGYSTAGGFIYWLDTGTISECYSSGNVSQASAATVARIGAFVCYADAGTIRDCYARGNATITTPAGTDAAGGFIGWEVATAIIHCYATGVPTAINMGGFVGLPAAGTYTACAWDTDTSGTTDAAGSGTVTGITGYTTAVLKTLNTIIGLGWNTALIWNITSGINDDYPHLQWQSPTPTAQPLVTGDRTVVIEKPVLEFMRNIEVQLDGRMYVSKNGDFTYESRYHRSA